MLNKSDFDDSIKFHNDVVAHRRQQIEEALNRVYMTPQKLAVLKELIAEFGDHAYEFGKFSGMKAMAPEAPKTTPAFSSDPDAPDVFEHTNGRWYINMGRPGFKTRINNSIGYATEAEADRVTTSYGKK